MIPKAVNTAVYVRDRGRCVVCGEQVGIEYANSHVVRRSRGGMGIIQNIVTHCTKCHMAYDGGDKMANKITMDYINSKYDGWKPDRVVYKKYGENNY